MFDKTKSGHINVSDFSTFGKFIQHWKNVFPQYHQNTQAPSSCTDLSQMGYTLNPQFTQHLVSLLPANPTIKLDGFIQVCTHLKVLAEAFWKNATTI